MSELPDGWTTKTFSEVFGRLQYGFTAKASPYTNGVRFLRITDIEDGEIDWDTVPSCSEADDLERYYLKDGDIVFARSGSVEKAARITNPPRAVFASYLIRGIPVTKEFSDWLAWFVRSPHYLEQVRAAAAGIGLSNVNARKLGAFTLPVPCLPAERQRIVTKLDGLFRHTKRAREELGHIPRLVERYRGAVLAAAFCGDLTKEWRLKEGTSVDGKWRQTTLGAVSSEVRYGTAAKCHYEPKRTPVLRIPNVVAGRIDLSDLKYGSFSKQEKEKLALKTGDLLVIRSNGSLDLVGRAALVPESVAGYLYAGYLIRIRLDCKKVYPPFVQLAFYEPSIRQHIESLAKSTSGVNNINSEQLKAITLRIPPLEEQKEIVDKIQSAFSSIDHLRDDAIRADNLLDRLDQATLAKAFRGELVGPRKFGEPMPPRKGRG